MVLGAIFGIILLFIIGVIVYITVAKPFGIDITEIPSAIQKSSESTGSSYDHPLLNEEQEVLLENLGIDTKNIPTQITPAQENCAIDALGAERVKEIVSGATPSISDYLKAKHCLE